MNKTEIRKDIIEKKKQMDPVQIRDYSAQLTDWFCSLPQYQEALVLFAYISYNQEVRTEEIIRRALAAGKQVAVPKVTGPDLEFRYIRTGEDLEPGCLGIREPRDLQPCADGRHPKVLMLMPGLAFDRKGMRIGYGKGYYDRYLARHPETEFVRIALCYDFQLLDQIPSEPFDQPSDLILSAPSGERIEVIRNELSHEVNRN